MFLFVIRYFMRVFAPIILTSNNVCVTTWVPLYGKAYGWDSPTRFLIGAGKTTRAGCIHRRFPTPLKHALKSIYLSITNPRALITRCLGE